MLALLVAMTAGTFLLLRLETTPAKLGRDATLAARLAQGESDLSHLKAINDTSIPLRADKWLHIVIHDSAGDEGETVGDRCHFVIEGPQPGGEDGRIRLTDHWRRQEDGLHVLRKGYRTRSIGICLVGDLDDNPPSKLQMERLIALVQALQARCRIGAEHVYRDDDLTGSGNPGLRFPDARFRDGLLKNF